MGRRRRAIAGAGLVAAGLVAVGLVLGGAAALGDAGTERTLVVEDDAGTTVLAEPVAENSTIVLAYTHSVEKTPVRDVYAVRGERLRMTRMEFRSFGAGLPARADVERTGDGGYAFRPDRRPREELVVSTGPVAGHELVVDGRRHDLLELADGGTVRIRVTTRLRI